MFFPTDLAWSKNDQAVVNPLMAIMPVFMAIAVSLAALVASLTLYLEIIRFINNISEQAGADNSSFEIS